MNTIPLLGTEFNSFIPVLVLLLCALSLWRRLREARRREAASDREGEDEDVKVGREVVDMALRKQGLSASAETERKRYCYHDVSVESCVCEQTSQASS